MTHTDNPTLAAGLAQLLANNLELAKVRRLLLQTPEKTSYHRRHFFTEGHQGCSICQALKREHELPIEDTADRLKVADVFTDAGDEARGEFVRVQCELAEYKAARRKVTLESARFFSPPRQRDGSFIFVSNNSTESIPFVGERIDLTIPKHGRLRTAWPGLLVHSVSQPTTAGNGVREYWIEFRQDEQSVPDPATELRRRERELIRGYAWRWMRDILPTDIYYEFDRWRETGATIHSKRQDGWNVTFVRGFVDEISLDLATWLQYADALVAATPLRKVTITTPVVQEQTHERSGEWYPVRSIRDYFPLSVAFGYRDTQDEALADVRKRFENRWPSVSGYRFVEDKDNGAS